MRESLRQNRRNFDWDQYLMRKKVKQRWSVLILFLCLPVLLLSGYVLWKGKHYLFMSFLVLAVVLFCFLMTFERRKPRAREIVLLAVMTAFCVGMNEICAHTIPLHAGTTMVVISGIALGPEAGFLIGALGRLLCNFFDGQGPWTPWQMAAWGMIGFLAGLTFNKVELHGRFLGQEEKTLARQLSLEKNHSFRLLAGPVLCIFASWIIAYLWYILSGQAAIESFWGWRLYVFGIAGLLVGCLLQHKKLPADTITTTVFTFVVVFLLYGGVMNFASMLMSYAADPGSNGINIETLKTLYLTGAPYDASHAGSAALCMFLFGDSMLQKLQRIQIKFGMIF